MAQMNQRFAELVAEALQVEFDVDVEPTVGGLTPDFVVTLPTGRKIVIEAKAWQPSQLNLDRAQAEAGFFREHLGSPEAMVVLPQVPADGGREGVVGLDELLDRLHDLEGVPYAESADVAAVEPPKAIMFCAMPFDPSYNDVFFVAMRLAAEANGLTARRVDQDDFVGDIVVEVHALIGESTLVVADLSESRPNVLYEVGYARGIGKPVVPICSTRLDEMPFNVAHNNTIQYGRGQTHELEPELTARVMAVLASD